jgi:hypothetical protein
MKFYSEYYNILIINCAKFHAAATFSFFVIKEGPRLIGRHSYIRGDSKRGRYFMKVCLHNII